MMDQPGVPSLVDRAIAGDHTAWRDLHREYYPIAVAFLRKLGLDREADVEDACQDVFVQMLRYLPSFRGEAELKTWLYRLCVTEAGRLRRHQRVSHKLRRLLALHWTEPASSGPELSEASARQKLEQAMSRMNDGMRLVFVLFEIEGLSGEQTAQIAGIPLASVWSRLHYARRIVQKTLGIETGGARP
jgi:RNA polymerase sigma-70 factor (ECF subfamily)